MISAAVLIVTLCLAADPDTCKDEHLLIPDLTPIACAMQGQIIALDYLEDHPAWRLRGWKCGAAPMGHPA